MQSSVENDDAEVIHWGEQFPSTMRNFIIARLEEYEAEPDVDRSLDMYIIHEGRGRNGVKITNWLTERERLGHPTSDTNITLPLQPHTPLSVDIIFVYKNKTKQFVHTRFNIKKSFKHVRVVWDSLTSSLASAPLLQTWSCQFPDSMHQFIGNRVRQINKAPNADRSLDMYVIREGRSGVKKTNWMRERDRLGHSTSNTNVVLPLQPRSSLSVDVLFMHTMTDPLGAVTLIRFEIIQQQQQQQSVPVFTGDMTLREWQLKYPAGADVIESKNQLVKQGIIDPLTRILLINSDSDKVADILWDDVFTVLKPRIGASHDHFSTADRTQYNKAISVILIEGPTQAYGRYVHYRNDAPVPIDDPISSLSSIAIVSD